MRALLALGAAVLLVSAACGKYGPPQRTLERAPAPAAAPTPAPAPAPAPDAPDEEGKDR